MKSIFRRSTLAGWVGAACWWLEALYERLARNVFGSDRLFADDTPVPVLDPGRGRTKTGRLWVYAREQRAWGGPEPPAAVYVYAPDRKAKRPASHLEHFRGVLHVDGYAGIRAIVAERGRRGRRMLEPHATKVLRRGAGHERAIAVEALRRIGELYAIEAARTVSRLHNGLRRVALAPSQSSTLCTLGSSRSFRCCRDEARSPKRSVTRWRAGMV